MSKQTLHTELPESSILFYRSRFEIFPDQDIHAEVWPQIIRVLQNWLEEKEGWREDHGQPNLYEYLTNDMVNYSSHFDVTYQDCYLSSAFAEGALSCECATSHLESQALKEAESDKVPRFWAFDYIERDSTRNFRRWRTNVGVTSSTSGTYVVNVRVAIYDDATFMGQAQVPERNTPNFMPKFLDIKDCVTIAGEMTLSSRPISISKDNFPTFLEDLVSPTRVVPLVVVSAYWDGEKNVFDIDPQAFARKLAGSAVVYTLSQDDFNLRSLYKDAFLTQENPAYQFRIPNGGVRVFLPGVHLDDPSDSIRHRFYTHSWLEEHDLGKVSDAICIGVSRLYLKRPDEVIDLFDVHIQENKLKREYYAAKYREMTKERNRLAHSSIQDIEITSNGNPDEENRSLRAENKLLWDENEKLEDEAEFMRDYISFLEASSSGDVDMLKEQLREAEEDNNHLTGRNSQLEYENTTLREEGKQCRKEVNVLKGRLESWDSLKVFPSSPFESVELAEALYGDRIIILDDAKKSAKEFVGDENEVFSIIRSVYSDLWPLFFDEMQIGTIDIESEYQNRSGFEMTLHESKTTKRDPKFMRLRERQYRGRKLDITPHIKGTSGRKDALLRVHFCKDLETGKIIIGHCGSHLDTAGTRHRK